MLKAPTKLQMFGIQDGVIATRWYQKDTLENTIAIECRVFGNKNETVAHLISGCEALTSTLYKN